MKIRETLLPGEEGTKELVEKYGDRLVCVRHRHDQVHDKRIRTVEIIVDESDWALEAHPKEDSQVLIRVDADEIDVRARVMAVGATWNPEKNAWQMNYRKALQAGLEERIIHEGITDYPATCASGGGCSAT